MLPTRNKTLQMCLFAVHDYFLRMQQFFIIGTIFISCQTGSTFIISPQFLISFAMEVTRKELHVFYSVEYNYVDIVVIIGTWNSLCLITRRRVFIKALHRGIESRWKYNT